MRIALLAPPLGSLTQAPLSLPSLTAFLRESGHEVAQHDLGIKCMDGILTPDYLDRVRARVNARASLGRSPGALSPRDQRRWRLCVTAALAASDWTIANIEEAKRVMRCQERFYRKDEYVWAKNAIRNALQMVTAAYFPLEVIFNEVRYPFVVTLDAVLDMPQDNSPFTEPMRSALTACLTEAPPLVGISITFYDQLAAGFQLAGMIKSRKPETHVVLGGAAIASSEDAIRRHARAFEQVDSYVFGEGEAGLRALAALLEEREPRIGMPGNVYVSPGSLTARLDFSDKDQCQRMQADTLPTPDYVGLNLQDYLTPEPMFSLSNARGCYYRKCAFCNVSLSFMRDFRQRSMKRVEQDIATLVSRHRARWFFFADDCVSPSRCRELADYVRRQERAIYWVTESRFEKAFSSSLLRSMYLGGCRQLTFGNESANQRVLDRMRKGTRAQLNRKIIRAAARAGIAVHLQNIVGFPGERASEARQTVTMLLEKRKQIASTALGRFHVTADSPVHRFPSQFGVTQLRRVHKDSLVPEFAFSCRAGMRPERVKEVWSNAEAALRRAYPQWDAFLDGVLGLHAVLYMTRFQRNKFEDIFGARRLPPRILSFHPRVHPDVVCSFAGAAKKPACAVFSRRTGACVVVKGALAAVLKAANGSYNIASLLGAVASVDSLRGSRTRVECGTAVALGLMDLYQSGLIALDAAASATHEAQQQKGGQARRDSIRSRTSSS
jgi:radical SAM superfamily enzyme YgiQ (UPF0313 family)/uncharacterized protein (DUF2237 family)